MSNYDWFSWIFLYIILYAVKIVHPWLAYSITLIIKSIFVRCPQYIADDRSSLLSTICTLMIGPMQTSFPSHSSPYPSKAPAACKKIMEKFLIGKSCLCLCICLLSLLAKIHTLVTFNAVAMIVITWK